MHLTSIRSEIDCPQGTKEMPQRKYQYDIFKDKKLNRRVCKSHLDNCPLS